MTQNSETQFVLALFTLSTNNCNATVATIAISNNNVPRDYAWPRPVWKSNNKKLPICSVLLSVSVLRQAKQNKPKAVSKHSNVCGPWQIGRASCRNRGQVSR